MSTAVRVTCFGSSQSAIPTKPGIVTYQRPIMPIAQTRARISRFTSKLTTNHERLRLDFGREFSHAFFQICERLKSSRYAFPDHSLHLKFPAPAKLWKFMEIHGNWFAIVWVSRVDMWFLKRANHITVAHCLRSFFFGFKGHQKGPPFVCPKNSKLNKGHPYLDPKCISGNSLY